MPGLTTRTKALLLLLDLRFNNQLTPPFQQPRKGLQLQSSRATVLQPLDTSLLQYTWVKWLNYLFTSYSDTLSKHMELWSSESACLGLCPHLPLGSHYPTSLLLLFFLQVLWRWYFVAFSHSSWPEDKTPLLPDPERCRILPIPGEGGILGLKKVFNEGIFHSRK